MDTTNPSQFSVSATSLAAALGWPCPPLLLDVRKNGAFAESTCMLPGALHRDPFAVAHWGQSLRHASLVVVHCVHGHEVSINTMLALRQMGIDARYLEGGIEGWRTQGLPVTHKPQVQS
jgi:Fe-Mn family superoxide dismutase